MSHIIDRPTTPQLVMDILEQYELKVVDTYSDKRRYTTFRKFVLDGGFGVSDNKRETIINDIQGEMFKYELPCNVIEFKFFESGKLGDYWGVCITNLIGDFTLLNRSKHKV